MSPHRISPSEWQVLEVLWKKSPATAADVFAALGDQVHWHAKTVNTFLARLVEKGFISAQRDGKVNVYSARVDRTECVRKEGESFLQRIFGGAAGPLLVHFCESAALTEEEVSRLQTILAGRGSKKKKGRRK